MQQLSQPSFLNLALIMGLSLGLHLLTLLTLQSRPPRAPNEYQQKVRVQVVEREKPPSLPPPPPAKEAPRPRPKAENTPRRPSKTASEPQKAPAEPVLGLNPDSFSKDGKGNFAVPAGNTTDAKDEGKRLTPEEVRGLAKDLSQDAELINSSFVAPAYTPEAEDAGLEGLYVVEVFVDAQGQVGDAELRNKIGFGMDERVLEKARRARFKPRRDPLGKAIEGWTSINIRLTLQ